MTPSRFDYVKYDETATAKQAKFKDVAQKVEAAQIALNAAQDEFDNLIETELPTGDYKVQALTNLVESGLSHDHFVRLEQTYMFVGKALRDEQIERNGSAELQEERKDG